MKTKRFLSLLLVAALILPLFITQAAPSRYGEVIGENMIRTYCPGGWGEGAMAIGLYDSETGAFLKQGQKEFRWVINWDPSTSGDYVNFNGNSFLAPAGLSVYSLVRGNAVVNDQTVSSLLSDTVSVKLAFDVGYDSAKRSFYDVLPFKAFDDTVKAELDGDYNAVFTLPDSNGFGAGTMWVRVCDLDCYSHLTYSDQGNLLQIPLSWASASGKTVTFKCADCPDIASLLRGKTEFDGKPLREYLNDSRKIAFCFEASDGTRRWIDTDIAPLPYDRDTSVRANVEGENSVRFSFSGAPDFGPGDMWIRVVNPDTPDYLKYVGGEPLQYWIGWAKEDANNMWFESKSGVGIAAALKGEFEIKGTLVKDLLEEGDEIYFCFESTNGARRWILPEEYSYLDQSVTAEQIGGLMRFTFADAPDFGPGTMWVRVYDPEHFGNLRLNEQGHELQFALSYKKESGSRMWFGVPQGSQYTLAQILAGEYLIDGVSMADSMHPGDEILLCFESNAVTSRRWYRYTPYTEKFHMTGDATEDGAVNIKDVVRIKKYLAGINYATGESNIAMDIVAADCNGDGGVSIKDVTRLKKYMAGYNYITQKHSQEFGELCPVSYTASGLEQYAMDRVNAVTAWDGTPHAEEMARAENYLKEYVTDSIASGKSAFDFKIGSESFAQTVSTWGCEICLYEETEDGKIYQLRYEKSGQPLAVTVYATQYDFYPIIEWTVWIENAGSSVSASITEFNAINQPVGGENEDADGAYRLTVFDGGKDTNESFLPTTQNLLPGAKVTRSDLDGRSTSAQSPYANLEWANSRAIHDKEGIFFSLGWPGEWQFSFENTGEAVQVVGGQKTLATTLNPGEKVRSPLMTLLFWDQDFMRAQNIWRKWLYNVAMPQPNGEPVQPMIYGALGIPFTDKTEQKELAAMSRWTEFAFDIDAWQIDAGWYKTSIDGEWSATGNWYPDPVRFPNGNLAAIGEKAEENGWDFILWYEPERFISYSDFYNQYKNTDWVILNPGGGTHIFNLANDEATDWLIAYLRGSITANKVDIYRQDCNVFSPYMTSYWERRDTAGRAGLTENQYVVNFLRLFDSINITLNDGFIDSCASGGKRMDLETLKRSAVLWRDDACYDPITTQCHSWSYNFLFPYSGQGTVESVLQNADYAFRSNLMTSMVCVWDMDKVAADANLEWHYKNNIRLFRQYAPYLTQNYFPLTPFNGNSEQGWLAMEYVNYEGTAGIVQAFRRGTGTSTIRLYLNGLQATKTYTVRNIDGGTVLTATGAALMQNGFEASASGWAAKIYEISLA